MTRLDTCNTGAVDRPSPRRPERDDVESALVEGRTDADLLRAIRDGERAAWDELVSRHQRRLWSIARSCGLDAETAHDALQTTWLNLLDHVDRIREPAALGGWLATVVKHEAIRLSKRGRRERERAERIGNQAIVEATPADDALVLDEELAHVEAALAQLSERCQSLLRVLFSSAEPSYSEVAASLGMPIGSLGPTRARCLERLRGLLS
jgi:RNA polymerase sigma factor (sigma-70 family)